MHKMRRATGTIRLKRPSPPRAQRHLIFTRHETMVAQCHARSYAGSKLRELISPALFEMMCQTVTLHSAREDHQPYKYILFHDHDEDH